MGQSHVHIARGLEGHTTCIIGIAYLFLCTRTLEIAPRSQHPSNRSVSCVIQLVGLHAMCRPVQVHATWARHASTRTEQNLAEQNSRIELIATTTCLFTAQFLFWTNPLGLADSTIRFGSPVANLVDIYSPALGPNILGHRS